MISYRVYSGADWEGSLYSEHQKTAPSIFYLVPSFASNYVMFVNGVLNSFLEFLMLKMYKVQY